MTAKEVRFSDDARELAYDIMNYAIRYCCMGHRLEL